MYLKKFLSVGILCCLALNLGCGQSSTNDSKPTNDITPDLVKCDGQADVPQYGIMGGKTLSKNSKLAKGVVYIVTSYYIKASKKLLGEASCTGALIDSNIIISAAHCFDNSGIEDYKPSEIGVKAKVYSGFRPFCQMDNSVPGVEIVEVAIHPNFNQKERSGDIALGRLTKAMPGEHTYYSLESETHDFKSGERLVAVGYGKTTGYKTREPNDRPLKFGFLSPNDDVNFRQLIVSHFEGLVDTIYAKVVDQMIEKARREALLRGEKFGYVEEQQFKNKLREEVIRYVQELTPSFDYSSLNENLVFDQSQKDGVCAGDSGGPGLREANGTLKIVGVAQAVFSYKSWVDDCKFGSVYTNVSFHKPWIIETFNFMKDRNTTIHQSGSQLFE